VKLVFMLTLKKTGCSKQSLYTTAASVHLLINPLPRRSSGNKKPLLIHAIAMTSLRIAPRNPSHCLVGLFSGDRVSRMTHS